LPHKRQGFAIKEFINHFKPSNHQTIQMNKLHLLIITICFIQLSNISFCQNDNPLPTDTIIKTHDLNNEQWQIWDSISDYWLKNEFQNCLKKNKLKLSCGYCASVYLTVNLFIDNEGKLSKYEIVKERVCGANASTQLKKCFFEYFETIVFPAPLRNINIQVQIGNGLKC